METPRIGGYVLGIGRVVEAGSSRTSLRAMRDKGEDWLVDVEVTGGDSSGEGGKSPVSLRVM